MKTLLSLSLMVLFIMGGCAFLEKIAPSQLDEQGNVLPGTHELRPEYEPIAKAIPYGEAAAGVFLLIWNFYEKARANKNEKGLKATILAIKQASDDPDIKEAVEKLKGYLSASHKAADIQPLINSLLAKLKV